MLNRQQRYASQQRVIKEDSIHTSNPRLKRLREMREIVDLRDQLDRIQHNKQNKRQGLGHSVSYRQGGGSGLLPGRKNGGEALFQMQKGTSRVSELPDHNQVGITAGGQRWLQRGHPSGGSRVGIIPGHVRHSLANLLSEESGLAREPEESDQFASRRLFEKQPDSMADDADLNRTTVGEGTAGSSLRHEPGRQKTSTGFGHYLETPNHSGKMTMNLQLARETGAALSDRTSEKVGNADRSPAFPVPATTTKSKLAKKNAFALQGKAGFQYADALRKPLRQTAGNLSMDLAVQPPEKMRSEVKTELISQFTSKISETAMSQRRLEQMGLRGLKQFQSSGSRVHSGKRTPTEQEQLSEQPSSPSLKITRFMSEKEKTTIWIQQQRQGLLDQSFALEAEFKREKEQEQAAAYGKSGREPAQSTGQASYLERSKLEREALPPLVELQSRGTNLTQRIRNYKANLTALDAPVMDQIQATQLRWNQVLEFTEAYKRSRQQRNQAVSLDPSARKHPLREAQRQAGPSSPTWLSPELGQRLGKDILQRMRGPQQTDFPESGPLVPPAKTKSEIRQSLEERRARLLREELARGAKMKGSTGGLDLSSKDFEQTQELRLPAKILQKRQLDLLVYGQQGLTLEGQQAVEGKGSGSTRSLRVAKQAADQRSRKRLAYSLGNHQVSALEIRQNMDLDEKLHGERTLISHQRIGPNKQEISSRERQHRRCVNNLGMLKNQKPTEKGKLEQFRRDHKRVISYIEDLETTIHNPLSYDWKKQLCLAESEVEGLERLGEMQGRVAQALQAPQERQPALKARMVQLLGQGSSILCTDESLVADNDSFQEMVKGIQSLAQESPTCPSPLPIQKRHTDKASEASARLEHRGPRTANETHEGGPWLSTLGEAAGLGSPGIGQVIGAEGGRSLVQSGGDGPNSPADPDARDDLAFDSPIRVSGPENGDDPSPKGSEYARGTHSDFTRTIQNGKFFRDANKQASEKKIVNEISDDLIGKLKQISKKRQYTNQHSKVYLAHNYPAFAFFAQCIRECQLDIPLFEKMHDSTLEIRNQRLSTGHCEAIKQGLRVVSESLAKDEGRSSFLSHVTLNNNGLGDAQLALILEGVSLVKAVKTFQSIGNELRQHSGAILARVLQRERQFALKELKLIDCRMSPSISEQLLKIVSQKCNLQTLSLCKAQYSPAGVRHLCTLIESAKSLSSLDISWCEMPMGTSNSFFPILEAISKNRRLESLDLSWNNLADIGRSVRSDPEVPSDRIPEPSQYPAQCASFLAAFIKYNKHAQHVRLDNCSLTAEMMEILTAAIRKAPALQALHLSNNPFISAAGARDVIEEIREKIHASKPYPSYVHMPQERVLNKPQSKHELLQLQAIRMKNESLSPYQLSVTDAFYNNTLILQRKLGHQVDMPGSAQWQVVSDFSKHLGPEQARTSAQDQDDRVNEDTESQPEKLPKLVHEHAQANCGCWICQNESYVLIFWSRTIQRRQRKRESRLQQLYVDRFAFHLSQGGTIGKSSSNPEAAEESPIRIEGEGAEAAHRAGNDDALPPQIISSSLNNWHPIKMQNMKSFVSALDPEGFRPPDYVRVLKDRKQVPEWAPDDPRQLAPNARRLYEEERCHFERVCRHQWINTLMGSVRYPKPELVNADLALKVFQATYSDNVDDWEDAYVIPVFLKPGKHTILVEWKQGSKVERTLQTLIVEPREAKVPPFQKQIAAKGQDLRTFHKPTSVFALYKESGPEAAAKCLEDHDELPLYKKLRRFIKDGDQLERVTKAVSDHMPQILHMYVNLQSQSSSYPAIPVDIMQDFASSLGILDNVCTPAIINIIYTSSTFKDKQELTDEQKAINHKMKLKVEKDKDALPLAQDMLRYEFIEFLIRVARAKYIETGQTKDYAQAFGHLFRDFVPLWDTASFKVQEWRKKQLWTLEANDCLEINLEGLKKLYKHLHHKTRKAINNKEAMTFMQNGATLQRKQAKRGSIKEIDLKDLKRLQSFDARVTEANLAKLGQKKDEKIQVGSRALTPADEEDSRASSAGGDDADSPKAKSPINAKTMKQGRKASVVNQGQDIYESSFLNLNERQAKACYAFAKMTVVNETGEGQFKYDTLQFVEFIDLLGQIANLRFVDTEYQSEPFIKRLEYIVESALDIVGVERKDPVIAEADISESDQDY